MDLGIAGRFALVTGGSRGIGRAIALWLAAEGVRVAVLGRDGAALAATCDAVRQAGGEASAVVADLAAPDLAIDRLDEVDILVHNAARFAAPRRLDQTDPPDWEAAIAVNLAAVARLSGGALRGMKRRRWGRVVFVGSIMGTFGGRGYSIYSTLKAAQEGLARSIALDYGPFGVTANVVAPGFVDTEHFRETAPPERVGDHAAAAALERLGKPDEIAAVVTFLASEVASFVTGATLPVGGGAQLNTRW